MRNPSMITLVRLGQARVLTQGGLTQGVIEFDGTYLRAAG